MELFVQPIYAASYFRHVLSVLVLRSSTSIFSLTTLHDALTVPLTLIAEL